VHQQQLMQLQQQQQQMSCAAIPPWNFHPMFFADVVSFTPLVAVQVGLCSSREPGNPTFELLSHFFR
jgi:hypothetical protein